MIFRDRIDIILHVRDQALYRPSRQSQVLLSIPSFDKGVGGGRGEEIHCKSGKSQSAIRARGNTKNI